MIISTPRLNMLPCLHLEPINLVFSQESMIPNLENGFALICFQRLSRPTKVGTPHVATQQCPWWNNWYTRGVSFPVLSY